MASCKEINITIKINSRPFRRGIRRVMLDLWQHVFGWRRFIMLDWWRIVVGLPVREPKGGQ
jgi:hypothetical protein